MAEVKLDSSASAELDELPRSIHYRMHKLLERLKQWPNVSGVKPLRGELAGHFRLRTGDYRLQFRIAGGVIFVEQIGHRDGFYE